MDRVVVGRSGIEVSRVGLGLSRIHHQVWPSERLALIGRARELGVTHFDAARLYGDGLAERTLGQALRGVRNTATISTKFGLLPIDWLGTLGLAARPFWAARPVLRCLGLSRWPRRSFAADQMRRSLARSLQLLGTEYVDFYFLHDPRLSDLDGNVELIDAMWQAKKSGQVRAIGLAGGSEQAEISAKFPGVFDVMQQAESGWNDAGPVPDFTFGVVSARASSDPGDRKGQVRAALQRALARRPQGAVLLGTKNPRHLDVVSTLFALEKP
jgi:aryl-alcohol dehydrogenase-like predicted oxidoreductase